MMEQWVEIKGFEGRYAVSDFGRVKSLPRTIGHGKGYSVPGIILKPNPDKDGYLSVTITVGKRENKRYNISWLVATHFISAVPVGAHVCHKDNNKENNAAGNLYIGSLETNTLDKYAHGSTKLSIDDVLKIRSLAGTMKQRELGEMFGVLPNTISRIINRKRGVFIGRTT